FYILPMSTIVSKLGLKKEHLDISVSLLVEMTKRFSSEGPIRPFIRKYPDEMFNYFYNWRENTNPHLRRLVSEGTRPRLPLSSPIKQFIEDMDQLNKLIDLIEPMMNDPILMVRRSVANNFNDISKDNPKMVINTFKKYKDTNNPQIQWTIRHGLRTLLKQGNVDALELLGFKSALITKPNLKIYTKQFHIGENLEFSLSFKSTKQQLLMIDYIIYFVKKNTTLKPKTFKWINRVISKNEEVEIKTLQSFKQMSTRKHYSGEHKLQIMMNGKVIAEEMFQVL
ncbi:MAG: DNA alkylation repair protein, partial [Candidatus Heimdallarchaeota archaeon]|nr:DNA alkylation repair protein [Candidatus Heimdallarchaeota archaeon]